MNTNAKETLGYYVEEHKGKDGLRVIWRGSIKEDGLCVMGIYNPANRLELWAVQGSKALAVREACKQSVKLNAPFQI